MAVEPTAARLAARLRELREQRWPDYKLTQALLATALGDGDDLAPATVSSWESQTAPKLPPADRLRSYARFFATRRSIESGKPRLVPPSSLTDEEQAERAALETELLGMRDRVLAPPPVAEVSAQRSWQFVEGPVTIVCAQLPDDETSVLADPSEPNFTELQSFADLDSLVELHGHLRRENPDIDVFFKASTKVAPDDLSGHVILLGGIAWNEITDILSEMTVLPVRQIRDSSLDSGEVFVVNAGAEGSGEGEGRKFLPRWRDEKIKKNLRADIGLLARTPNPLNSNRTLTICNGIHSRGVLGAVRCLTDARLRVSNEKYLAENFEGISSFALLLRVPVIEGRAMTPDFNTLGSILYRWPENPDI